MSAAVDPRILSRLAAHDRQVHECRFAIAASRRKIADLESTEAESQQVLDEAKKRLTEAKLEIRKIELEIDDLHRQVKTHNHRLNEISDTREYRALGEEVRYLQRQIESKEEDMLKLMEESEKQEGVVKEATADLEAKRADHAAKREQIEAETSRHEAELAQATERFDAFLEDVPEVTLRFYRRKEARQEMPVVWEREGACSYCHHKLTPQADIEVRKGKSLVVCESCGRVVVAPDASVARPSSELP